MGNQNRNRKELTFPFKRADVPRNRSVSARRWKYGLKRTLQALRTLEDHGYESAPFLREVLLSFDKELNSTQIKSEELYESATSVLSRARSSSRLKRFLRTRNREHSDTACCILKRAIKEIESIAGELRLLDIHDEKGRKILRTQLVGVLLTILTAETQVPQPS